MSESRENDALEPLAPGPAILRLAPDAHRTAWCAIDHRSPYKVSERTYYYDQDAPRLTVYLVTAQVGFLLGSDHTWRYSVGLKVRADNDAEHGMEFLEGFTLGYGDVGDEDEAKRLADECALAWLADAKVPDAPPPIPNLHLVTPAPAGQTQLDFIKRRLETVQEFADHVHDEDYEIDEGMRATLARVGYDLAWLIDTVEEAHAALTEAETELQRLDAARADGSLSDGHHSYTELYEQRMLYHAHLAQRWHAEGVPIVKSKRHHTGKECFGGGWFIVVMELPTGQASQHYPLSAWNLFAVPAVEQAPQWDGHTADQGGERLRAALHLMPPGASMPQLRCPNPERHDPHPHAASRVFWCATRPTILEGP